MSSTARVVRVRWRPREEGGRAHRPTGHRYVGTIHFADGQYTGHEWSVILESGHLGSKGWFTGHLSFVSERAPQEKFVPGTTFQLFEGRWPVADGEVIPVDPQ